MLALPLGPETGTTTSASPEPPVPTLIEPLINQPSSTRAPIRCVIAGLACALATASWATSEPLIQLMIRAKIPTPKTTNVRNAAPSNHFQFLPSQLLR